MNRWQESFEIFAWHGLGPYDVNGYHDLIETIVAPSCTSRDGQRLLELGWHKTARYDDDDNIVGYEDESHWQHHT
jgi:hypothetical protein